ncbi:transporter substrate-binding domain-containing protein [Paenalcaligenes niemegkensis]|uniref:transporter substrate-binding domain-containing protein n=1 Tax=Paenalcaligenes niemegkensis TaxID=2895469 RepID=UPI0035696913
MVDATGKVTGFDADIGAALCKELDADCTFVVQAFDSLIPSLSANRFDLIISGMSYTPERAKRISFSVPYVVEDAIFLLSADSDLIKAADSDTIFDGLDGKTIGVQGGTTHGAFLEKIRPKRRYAITKPWIRCKLIWMQDAWMAPLLTFHRKHVFSTT